MLRSLHNIACMSMHWVYVSLDISMSGTHPCCMCLQSASPTEETAWYTSQDKFDHALMQQAQAGTAKTYKRYKRPWWVAEICTMKGGRDLHHDR